MYKLLAGRGCRQNLKKAKFNIQNETQFEGLERTDSEPTLRFIDFKLGNVCNLKCRICGSWSSSKWAQEEMDYGPNPLAKQQLYEGGWPKRHPEFFDDIKPVLADVEYFEFTGGEPFMIQNHFKMLEHCVEQGYSKKQDIHYNTNGTQLPDQRIFDLWSKFKHVEIAFSIDDVENVLSISAILPIGLW
jgi:sulfatase maturation enzyme AslB (radical SAM superfamily)